MRTTLYTVTRESDVSLPLGLGPPAREARPALFCVCFDENRVRVINYQNLPRIVSRQYPGRTPERLRGNRRVIAEQLKIPVGLCFLLSTVLIEPFDADSGAARRGAAGIRIENEKHQI